MEQIILVVHLLVALGIIGLIMMQQGKGSDIGASFGAGGSQTLLGSVGSANVLTKLTAWLVAAFFASSFGLAMLADSRTAGEDDLGFELPMEAVEAAPVQSFESDLPVGDIPETAFESDGSDFPSLDSAEGDVIDSGQDLPEG
ncbi:preprotein translocase subunit SecG [Luminiphilus sp. nBUS_16]|uniref:preprotein translocase subunit SecG n=1 Tax=Luminiphilus sp. nBUS_16 TaxID=3395315 RepID=UPI003EBB578C